MSHFAAMFAENEIGSQPVTQIPWGTLYEIICKSSSKEEISTVLLLNVKRQGVVVANHLWITDAKLFFEMNIKENTKIQFKAAVYEYVKGYLGKKPVLGKRLLKVDYTLIYISDIKINE